MSSSAASKLGISFATLAATTSDGLLLCDEQGVISNANEHAAQIMGEPIQQLIGRNWSEFSALELPAGSRLRGHPQPTSQPSRMMLRRANDELCEVRVATCPAGGHGGRLFFLSQWSSGSTSVDGLLPITPAARAPVEAEPSTADSDVWLRLILDSTGEGIYGIDRNGLCTFANKSCLRLLGFDRVEEVLGCNMHDLIHSHHADGRDYPLEACSIFMSFKTGRALHAQDEVFWTKSGQPLPVKFWSYPIEDGTDRHGVVVVFQNATSQLAAEEDQARLAAIVNGSMDAIISKSLTGNILTWNRGAEDVYGYAASEVIGRPISVILGESSIGEESDLSPQVLSTGGVRKLVAQRRRKDGREITVSIAASPVLNTAGETIGTATIERDVTADRVRESELQLAKEQAEAANRIKSEFVANISHELRTPMNAILGMIDVVRRNSELPVRLRDYLGTAHDSARSMLSLVNDLLDFSRLDAGRLELIDAPFSLRDTLDEAMRILALRARDRGLELACHVRRDVPDELSGDGRRLRQIVMNLVGNAIKFTPAGEVVLHASVESSQADAVELHLRVVDSGIGIPPEMREQIFEPFTQVDASDTRSYSGSGLGLTISRKIADLMQGRIWCEANAEGGSTFHCVVQFKVRQPLTTAASSTAAHLRNRSVLIIEQHQATREILSELVSAWGMSPHVVNDTSSSLVRVLDEAKQAGCEIVIVDADLIDRGDDSLLDRLRQDEGLSRTILLVPPGESDIGVASTWNQSGAAAFVEKPVSQSDLLESIIRTLGDHSPAGAATWIAPIASAPKSLHLLVAEDIPANQKVVRSILELRGHSVEIVGNGREAVEQASRRRYDAILMDIRMPVLSGIEATRQIRKLADPRLADVPIIALTAHVLEGDRKRCLQIGMNAFVTKPIDAEELIRSVEIVTASVEHGRRMQMTEPFSPPPVEKQPVMSTNRPAISIPQALARIGGDRQLLADMAMYFREDVPQLYRVLTDALAAEDVEEATRAAHSIKGLAANFDAFTLRDTAAKMEDACRSGRLPIARELLERCQQELDLVLAALQIEFPSDT